MTAKGFLLLLILPLVGCSSVARKQSAAESAAIYSTQKAIEAGRFDLAKQYNAQAARLVPAPKKEPKVAPVISQGKRYVVLPPEFNATPAIAIGSPAADTLISQDKRLQGQLRAEDKALAQTEKATDNVIAEKEKIVEKAETEAVIKSHTFWGRVKFYGIVALGIAALVALCIFFPAAIPILAAIGRALAGIFSALVSFVGRIFTKWTKNKDDTP